MHVKIGKELKKPFVEFMLIMRKRHVFQLTNLLYFYRY
jgi:hypothetical protein